MVGHASAAIVLSFSLLGADAPQAAAPAGNAGGGQGEPAQRAESNQVHSEPVVPPVNYLRAGATLFNQGKYTLAGKYLEAAYRYRDRLSRNEQIVLDVYLDELTKYRNQVAGRTLADPGVKPAAAYVVDPPAPTSGGRPAADASKAAQTDEKTQRTSAAPPAGDAHPHVPAGAGDTAPAAGADKPAFSTGPRPSPLRNALRFETTDVKQKARWLLQCAREEIFRGRFDEARQYVEEARSLNVKWGYLEETPDKVVKAIEKARVRAAEAKAKAKSSQSDAKPKAAP